MQFLIITGLFISGISSAAGQTPCIFGDISGEVYENAPNGMFVTTLTVSGDLADITLSLGSEYDKYFEIIGKSIVVKNSTALDRSNVAMPAATRFATMVDSVICGSTSISSPIDKTATIVMYYTNKVDPTLTSASTVVQSEITAPGTMITTLTANDGDDTTFPVAFSTDSEYFEINSASGELTLIKEINFDVTPKISLQVNLTDEGVDALGNSFSRTSTQDLVIDVVDNDKFSPVFQPCDESDPTLCLPPLYTTNFIVGQTGPLINIEPQSIEAIDGDASINALIVYSIFSGSADYIKYFEIDGATGVVTVVTAIPQEGAFLIAIKAEQDDNPAKFSIAYLQVIAYVPDDAKPVISASADLSDAYLIDDGSEQLYVEDSTGNRIKLTSEDSDGSTTLVYMIDPPEPFQVLSNGYIFASRSDLFSTRAAAPENFNITSINIEASTTSPNRISDPFFMSVNVIEMTTAATTEATTFPETTEATSLPVTTPLETTPEPTTPESTTPEPTTLETTAIYTSVASTTEEATTFLEPTTLVSTAETAVTTEILLTSTAEISTATTLPEPTTASTIDDTTAPQTTTYLPTEATTVISTIQPTTQPEITTVTTEISTIPPSTVFSTVVADTTAIATTEPATTQQSSSTIPATTLQTFTSQTSDQSTVVSTTATTPEIVDQTSADSSTLATDVSSVTEMSSTISTMSTAVVSDATVASTSSETTVTVPPTPSDETTAAPSSVETTTTKSDTSAPSISDSFTSMAPDITETTATPEDVSTARPVVVTTTDNQSTKDGTVIVGGTDDMVPISTLIGVAVGLSCALFISIIVIIFLLLKLREKGKDPDEEGDKSSVTSSQTHENDAYTEVDEIDDENREETDDPEPNYDIEKEVGVTSAFTAVDMEESGVDMQNDPDASSHEEIVDNEYEGVGDTNAYADADEAVQDLEDAVSEEIELTPSNNEFEQELLNKASIMAATAAATALVAKAVEEPAEPEPSAEIAPNLSPDAVTEVEVIKEDVYHSVKLVMLKGCGEDGFDVKAVLTTIDTDMSTSADVNRVRKRISILEQLSKMDHPNILKYYGCFLQNDSINYALRYAENGNLRDKLKSGTLSSHELMLIMANVGKGLQYLHAKNITHGNIWAKAIMLDGMNTPMLTDIDGSSRSSLEYKEIMRWQAAEVLNHSSNTTPATDVWSFGVLMWEIVSQGATPYQNVPLQELCKKIQTEQLRKPKGCSDNLFSVMENCWKKNHKLRDDMYGINNRLSELLLEDSNEHIQMNQSGGLSGSQEDIKEQQSDNESNTELTAF